MLEFFPERAVAIQVGSIAIYWYGVLYVVAMINAWVMLPLLQKYRGISWTREEWLNVVTIVMAGAVIGGRLGYVLLYEWVTPWAVWQGGMSSHGGFVGAGITLWLVSRWKKVSLWQLTDIAVVPAALGLALGRVGNFINQELYGRLIDETGQRYPVAWLAAGKDLFLALVGFGFIQKASTGTPTAVFLMGYGLLRFMLEYFRESTHPLWFGLTRGQTLSMILAVVGLSLFLTRRNRSL